jgi:hypothetical protein
MAVFSYTGNQQSLSSGVLEERGTFSYNESSIVSFESEDYGLITDLVSYYDNFGDITESITSESQIFNYGSIVILKSEIPFGTLSISTEFADVSLVRNSVGGLTFLVHGKAKIYVLPIHIGSGRIRPFGHSEDTRTAYQEGSGALFGFDGAAKSTTNTPPEAKLRIHVFGGAFHAFSRGNYSSTGLFSAFTGAGLSRVIITKSEDNIFRFSGSAVEKNAESYVGSGALFGFVGHAERVAYDYNESSVIRPEGIDYGFVSEIHTSEDDFGLISEEPSPQKPWNKIDYGYITDNDTRIPFGKFKLSSDTGIVNSPLQTGSGTISVTGQARLFVLPIHKGSGKFSIGGSAEPAASLSHIASGTLFGFIGTAVAKATAEKTETKKSDIKLSGSSPESVAPAPHVGSGSLSAFTGAGLSRVIITKAETNIFKFIGSAEEKNAESYIGSGALFGFVGHAEKVTYDYNESSIVTIDGLDYGFVSEIHTSEDDYGFISEPTNYGQQKLNYGYITDNINKFPYGRFRFSDDKADIKASLSHVGSGSLFAFTGASETVLSAQETTGLFKFLGSAQLKSSLSHVGSGSLFAIVGGQEAIVQEPHIGSGSITIFGSAVERNTESYFGSGRVKVFSTPIPAYRTFGYDGTGKLQITKTNSASIGFSLVHVGSGSLFAIVGGQEAIVQEPHIGSGKITLSGAATDIKNTESYVGSGSLFAFTGASETVLSAQETTGLFKFFGSVDESTTPAPHIGSGSLFAFVGSAESTTNVPSATGLFKFVGSAVEKNTESYVGSGRIFAFTGTAESTTNAPSATGLFKFLGSAVEKNTESYVGSGSLFAFTGASETVLSAQETTGLFKFLGSAVEKNTESYVGSGSLFAFVGSTSVSSGALRVQGPVFKLSGSSSIGFTLTETGSGVFNLRQRVSGTDALNKQRYISGIERKTNVAKTDGALFRYSGEVRLFFQYTEVGSGFITLAGDARTQTKPVHVGEGTFTVFGSAATPRTRPYIGSGSLFGLNSATTIAASRPPVSGTLFKFAGSAVEKNSEAYNGTTSAIISGSANIIARLKHIGSGKATVFGTASEKNTESYVGSGRIFGFTGSAESIGRKLPEFRTLFRFSGSGTVRNLYTHTGSGSLFTFVSKTESSSSTETKTNLFRFAGSASERSTETYTGSGLISFRTKDSILDINGKVIFISAEESLSVVPPTRIQLFKFSGAAKTERNTNWNATGSLFGFGGGAERVSFTPGISTTLFDFVGTAQERKSRSYAGSGSIFGFVGAAESSAVVSTTGGLFRITGAAKESVLPATYVGSGSLFAFISKTESVAFSPSTTTLFKFTGNAIEKHTEAYLGTGRVFGFQSAGIARVVPYDRTKVLFRILGASKESFEFAGYIGNVQAEINGISEDRYIEYDSPKPIRIYII